jgi:hypothetical protein
LILSTISYLIQKKEFHPESKLKNIAMVLGLYVMFAEDVGRSVCENDDDWSSWTAWQGKIVKLAQEHNIQIQGKGPYGVDKVYQEIEASNADEEESESDSGDEDEEDAPDGFRKWSKWDWKTEVSGTA